MEATLVLSPDEALLLHNVPLFTELHEQAMQYVSARLKRRRFRRGEVVYHTEDLPGSLYIVLSGELKLRLQSPGGRQLTMSWIRPGSFFGTISLLDGQERLADAIAVRPCELLVLGRDDFRSFLRRNPHQAEVLLEITAARWRNTMRRLAELAFLDVPGRLAKALLELRRTAGQPAPGAAEEVNMTQTELAAMIGTSRESVGRWLKAFGESGLIESRPGRIVIINPGGLQAHIRW
jgi:CRP/FNR family transcriptional regulator/CRP/FNR family cyclic AMP-dependent transcriptional regulator